jgi:hypothetical protein
MNKPLAIRAGYADMKIVKTRQVVQLIFELPISQFDAAYEVLGGLPTPDSEKWFAIAAIKDVAPKPSSPDARPEPKQDKPARAKRDWHDLMPSQQAGIRCGEILFLKFLEEERMDDLREGGSVPDTVRMICGVQSRSELNTNQKARVVWHQLNDQYEAWMRVGA